MDTAKWPQEIVMKAMEETTIATKPSLERKMMRPQREEAVNCPRCNSTNTKFCYYNNYSLSQPRYFCKTCRRYWTEGGSLRNIPVGGGSRKNRINIRASSSSSSSSNNSSSVSNSKKIPAASDPSKIHCHDTQELNLGFPNSTKNDQFRAINELIQVPNFDISSSSSTTSSSSPSSQALASSHGQLSAMELLTGISTTSVGLNSFHVPMLAANYSTTGFSSLPQHDHQFKLNFSLDGTDNSTPAAAAAGGTYGSSTFPETNNNGKVRFPFEDLKQVENNTTDHNQDAQKNRDDHQHGYWSGIIGGGSW